MCYICNANHTGILVNRCTESTDIPRFWKEPEKGLAGHMKVLFVTSKVCVQVRVLIQLSTMKIVFTTHHLWLL